MTTAGLHARRGGHTVRAGRASASVGGVGDGPRDGVVHLAVDDEQRPDHVAEVVGDLSDTLVGEHSSSGRRARMCWEGTRRTGPRLRRCGLGRPRYGPLAPRAFRAGLAFLPLTALVLAANVLSRADQGPGNDPARAGLHDRRLRRDAGRAIRYAVHRDRRPPDAAGRRLGDRGAPMTNALMGSMERSRSGSLVAAHGQFIYGFRTALAISIELVITGMLIASRIRQPRSSAGTMTAGTPDRQTGAGQADTQLVRDHRRPYSPERTTRPSASSAGQFPRPSCVCGGVDFLLAGNGAGSGVRNRSPRFAGSLGRVLLVQADEQGRPARCAPAWHPAGQAARTGR
jgi:hypothetical protein